MDRNGSALDTSLVYPLLCIPKKCTNLETNCSASDNVFIDVTVTSPDVDGNNTCIYSGFCNIKLVGDYDVQCYPQESDLNDDGRVSVFIADGANSMNNSQVWIDPSRSPYVYNQYNESGTQDYSVCTQTRTSQIIQHNTYITNNVYNYKEAVRYNSNDQVKEKSYKEPPNCRPKSPELNMYDNDEFECGVYMSNLPEEIMQEKQNRDIEEWKYINIQSENGALTQLMSSDIQTLSKQRKTILYLGPEPENGQTIQQIEYTNPTLGCSAGFSGEVENEVIIDEDEDMVIPRQKKYQCVNCYQIFDQLADFREHMVNHAQGRRQQKPREDLEVRFTCSECGKTLKTREKFEMHCMGHGDPDLECSKCRKVFASKFTLRAHRKIHNRKYPCKNCTKTFAKVDDLQAHVNKKHVLVCDLCNFLAYTYTELVDHNKSHESKDSSETELADSIFEDVTNDSIIRDPEHDWKLETMDSFTAEDAELKSEEKLKKPSTMDENAQDGNKNVADGSEDSDAGESVTAKVMANKAFTAMKKRNRKYTKRCNVCGKPFDRISDLKRHLIEHVVRVTLTKSPVNPSGILNLRCEVCQESFNYIDSYKAHLREHAKLTIYKCTFCNKSFSDSSNFSKHKKIHGATYFQCDLCLRKFNSKKMLIRHIEYHNTNAPLPCLYCGREFHFESMLNKHIKSAHTKEISNKFRCRFCFKYYKTLKEKWDHEWRVHNVRKMVVDCLICDSKFRKYAELKRHCQDIHNVEIPPAKRLLKKGRKKFIRAQ